MMIIVLTMNLLRCPQTICVQGNDVLKDGCQGSEIEPSKRLVMFLRRGCVIPERAVLMSEEAHELSLNGLL